MPEKELPQCEYVELVAVSHGRAERDAQTWKADVRWAAGACALAVLFTALPSSAPAVVARMAFLYWAIGLALLLSYVFQWRLRRRRIQEILLAEQLAGETPRRVCFGKPRELEQLASITAEPFTPIVCVAYVLPLRATLAGALAFGMIAAGINLFGERGVIAGLVTYGVLVFGQRSFGKYYRLSPQYLELLRAFPWQSAPSIHRQCSLTNAAVYCRYDDQVVVVVPARTEQQPILIDLCSVAEPHRLVESLFRAARACKVCAPLSKGHLVG